MSNLLLYFTNSRWCSSYKSEYRKYVHCKDIKGAQENILLSLLRSNQDTEYGKKYGFERIESVEDFRESVPLTIYEDYIPWIERIESGEDNVLTAEDVLMFEKTSGSTSATKMIPYTSTLKSQFQNGIRPWIYDLYKNYPKIKWGKSYWSVTPAGVERQYTEGGIPIGFEDDTEYFGENERKLMDRIFAVPGSVAKEQDMDVFYFKTAKYLLEARNLTLISVWNPTFLLLILDYMHSHKDELLEALPKKIKKKIEKPLSEKRYSDIWKKLRVISCWADQNAAKDSEKIKEMFPAVILQPKGILATEGLISFPLVKNGASGISHQSHFFEFRDIDDNKFYEIDQLIKGKRYEVIITTGGGLYRYRMNDIVEVSGYTDNVPLVSFEGRLGKVSDLFGEKINERFITFSMMDIISRSDFCMLAPETDHYVLYVKADRVPTQQEIDKRLRENFHYDHCRKLGQLKEVQVFVLNGDPGKEYVERLRSEGQKLGDIKNTSLSLEQDWASFFTGKFLEQK